VSMLESIINILSIPQYANAKLGIVHLKPQHVKTSLFMYMLFMLIPTISTLQKRGSFLSTFSRRNKQEKNKAMSTLIRFRLKT